MATTIVETYKLSGGKYVIEKDPNAVLDYGFDWSKYLAPLEGDVITDVEFILEATLAEGPLGFSHDDTTATVWVQGGEVSKTLRVTCRITTAAGRIDDRSVFLKIVER